MVTYKRRTKEEIAEDNALVAKILHSLDTNPQAVVRALIVVGEQQTPEEQASEATLSDNRVGWTAFDARFGTFLYGVARRDGVLHGKLLDQARQLVKKYAKTQLFAAAKAKARK